MNLSFSPKIVYPSFILLLAVGLAFFIYFNKSDSNSNSSTQKQAMPSDSIHGQLGANSPSGNNVMSEAKTRMEETKKAIDSNPTDTAKIREYAMFLAAHKPAEAIPYFEKILKINPNRADIYSSIAALYFQLENFNKSEEYQLKAVQIDNKNPYLLYDLGAIVATKGEKEKAKKIWQDLISKFPGTEAAGLANVSIPKL